MSNCPSCGRYVGPYERCPYCGACTTGRLSIRVVKCAAILLSTVGLALLWIVARRVEVPVVTVEQVGAAMNLAHVRVEGRCSRGPSLDPDTGYLSFWVADETGELRVVSYRAQTDALIDQRRVPGLGDWVSVAGTLRVREDFPSLTVNAPQEVNVARDDPEACSIGAIGLEQTYRRVLVRGVVRRHWEPYSGLTLLTVRDETGSINVAISEDLVALSGPIPTLQVGQAVEVAAVVSDYQGEVQLLPASAGDVVPLHEELPVARPSLVGELSPVDAGRWVAVEGVVVGVKAFSEGLKLRLDDGSGSITILLWRDVQDALEAVLQGTPGLEPGARLEVQGSVAEYAGELEVVPELAADVRVLSWAAGSAALTVTPQGAATPIPTETARATKVPRVTITSTGEASQSEATVTPTVRVTSTPSTVVTALGAVTSDDVGKRLSLEGRVVDAVSFSHGFSFKLDDGTGQIVLLMWHNVYDDCWDRGKINLGALVRASGEIGDYEGKLQIEPRFGGGVKVREPATNQAPRREISSLTAEDEGKRVMIEGEVVRTEGLSSAVKVLLRDVDSAEQGEIMVFIWRNLLDRITDNVGLGTPGSRIRVAGRVQVYRSNLELVPPLPNDVAVLEIP